MATCEMAHRRSGAGRPIVLVHGIPGQGRSWEQVEAELTPGFDVITPDLVGFGESGGPRELTIGTVGPAAQAAHVVELLDQLGLRGVTLVGHDFGAPVAILVTASRPDLVGALVLLSGNAFPDTPIPFPLSLVNVPVIGGLCARALFSSASLGFMLRQGVGPGAPTLDAATYLGSRSQRKTIATIFTGALTRLAEVYAPVASALNGVEIPVTVGWGDQDPFFPLEQAKRTARCAGARLRVFEGAGHFLPHERPVEVAAEITATAAIARR